MKRTDVVRRAPKHGRAHSAGAIDSSRATTKQGGPWFCCFNPTRMHVFTHLKASSAGKTGLGG